MKPDHETPPLSVACEFVCSRLLAMIGLPTPAGETASDFSQRTVWVNLLVQLEGQQVAPDDPAAIVARDPGTSSGIFVFDVWTLNSDRHDATT